LVWLLWQNISPIALSGPGLGLVVGLIAEFFAWSWALSFALGGYAMGMYLHAPRFGPRDVW